MHREHKQMAFEVKAVSIDDSSFEGYSAGIGNLDGGDDRIMSGAFKKTIRQRVKHGRVKFLDGHDGGSTRNLWGIVTDANEEAVSKKKVTGQIDGDTPSHLLWTEFKVTRSDPDAQVALRKIEEGILDALSIGYMPKKFDFVPHDKDNGEDAEWLWFMGQAERQIKELAWWETSAVVWGMNEVATVLPGTVKDILAFAEKAENVSEEEIRQVFYQLKQLMVAGKLGGRREIAQDSRDGVMRSLDAVAGKLDRVEAAATGTVEQALQTMTTTFGSTFDVYAEGSTTWVDWGNGNTADYKLLPTPDAPVKELTEEQKEAVLTELGEIRLLVEELREDVNTVVATTEEVFDEIVSVDDGIDEEDGVAGVPDVVEADGTQVAESDDGPTAGEIDGSAEPDQPEAEADAGRSDEHSDTQEAGDVQDSLPAGDTDDAEAATAAAMAALALLDLTNTDTEEVVQ